MSTESPINLLVRADDAAGSIAANRAILETLLVGVVRNVSVMGCGHPETLQDWASRFYRLPDAMRQQIDIGLHVTLNAEWSAASMRFRPCLDAARVPSLVEADTGFFIPSPGDLYRRGWGAQQVKESLREVAAQLQCVRAVGLDPVYLDEHMGVGWLPGLRDALICFAHEEGLIASESLALPNLPLAPLRPEEDADALTAGYLAAVDSTREALPSSVGSPLPFLLVAHPACDGAETRLFFNSDIAPGVVAAERERERQALTRPDLAARLRERGARFVRYRDAAPTA